MTNTCTPGTFTEKENPLSKKTGIFSDKDSNIECFQNLVAHLLQETGQALLLAEGGYIKK